MVFIDNSNGEESIELVNHSMESSNELSTERKDIVEVIAVSFISLFSHLTNRILIGKYLEKITLQEMNRSDLFDSLLQNSDMLCYIYI